MTTCPHTGITVPECSCTACVRRLIERHMPTPAVTAPAALVAEIAPEPTTITDASGARGMLRRLRRSRLRRPA